MNRDINLAGKTGSVGPKVKPLSAPNTTTNLFPQSTQAGKRITMKMQVKTMQQRIRNLVLTGGALICTSSFAQEAYNVTLQWDEVEFAQQYRLEERLKDATAWEVVYEGADLTAPLTGRAAGDYEYQVISCVIDPAQPATPLCDEVADWSETAQVTLPLSGNSQNIDWASTASADIQDVELPSLNVAASDFFGATPGEASVSGGAASYHIPIMLPPGRAGMQPNVSLDYSSRSGNGIAGVGWNLSAGSSISRCPNIIANEGVPGGIQFDMAVDKLCLDGQFLVLVNGGSYGAQNSEYRTELDNMTVVTLKGGSMDTATAYFEVKMPNNHSRIYGLTNQQFPTGVNKALSWLIDKESDYSGNNVIHYHYTDKGDGEVLLSHIQYTGNSTSEGNRKVAFEYEDKTPSTRYLWGGTLRQTQRLNYIKTYYADGLVRQYKLNYKQSPATNRSLLNDVEECAAPGTADAICRNTSLDWHDSPINYELQKLELGNRTDSPFIYESQPYGDLNGDGVRDWPKQGGGTQYFDAEENTNGSTSYVAGGCINNGWLNTTCIHGDFNRDGITDSWRLNSNDYLQVSYTTSSGLQGNWITTNIQISDSSMVRHASIQDIADYNGDGWIDLAVLHNDGSVKIYFHSQNLNSPYSQSNGFTAANLSTTLAGNSTILTQSVSFVGDIDGNGLPDLVINQSYDIRRKAGLPMPRPKQFLLSQRSGSNYGLTSVDTPLSNLLAATEEFFSYFMDVNSDGLPDLLTWENTTLVLYVNQGGGNWSTAQDLGIGQGLATTMYTWYNAIDQVNEGMYGAKYSSSLRIMDLNGDGKPELLVPDQNIAKGCRPFAEGGTWTVDCGDDLYGAYALSNLDYNESGVKPSSQLDDGLYTYKAMIFTEDANGNISAAYTSTPLIGSATQTAVVDGFGRGLNDFVFTYRPRIAAGDCSISNGCRIEAIDSGYDMTPYDGQYGVYGYINTGSGTDSVLNYQPVDFVQAVHSATGNVDTWQYRPLTSRAPGDDYYQFSRATAGDADVRFASSMMAVWKYSQSNGIGTELNDTRFKYRDATYNFEGRGFGGFTTILEYDDTNLTRTETDFELVFPKTGQVKAQRQYAQAASTPFNTLSNDWQENPNYTRAGLYNIYNHQAVSQSYDITSLALLSTSTDTVVSIDQYGNNTSTTHVVVDDYGIYSSAQTADYSQASDAWPHMLSSTTVVQHAVNRSGKDGIDIASGTDSDKTVTTRIDSYTANRQVEDVTTLAGGVSTTTHTTYTSYGLVDVVTISGTVNGVEQVRRSDTDYSSDGYFPNQLTRKASATVNLVTHMTTDAATGLPTQSIDENAVVTSSQYDALGRLKQVDVTGYPSQYVRYYSVSGDSHAPTNALMSVHTQQAGTPVAAEYKDLLGRTLRKRTVGFDGSDIYQDVSYNARGLVSAESVPYKAGDTVYQTTYSNYDLLGRPGAKISPQTNGQLDTSYTYDGLTTTINVSPTSGQAIEMSRTYNSLKQLMNTVDADLHTTSYAYDGAGNPIRIRDAALHDIDAKYDALGRKEWVDDPNQGRTAFTYSDFGELESQTDANNDTITYTLDFLGRVTARNADGTVASFNFDPLKPGLLGSQSQGTSAKAYTYDGAGRPLTTTATIDGQSYTTTLAYDANFGRLKSMTYPNDLVLGYEYNEQGYLRREYNGGSDYTYREVTEQDVFGNITQASIGSGTAQVEETMAYSQKSGQMLHALVGSSVGGQDLQALYYSAYDSYGNLKQQQNQLSGFNSSEDYSYDKLQRLTATSTTGQGFSFTVDYGYDAVGNLKKKSDYSQNNLSAYSYATGSNKLESVALKDGGTVSYGYDAKGNRTHRNTLQEIQYDVFNKPTHISRGGSFDFVYGADLARVKQVRTVAEQTTTYYIDKHYEVEQKNGQTTRVLYISDVAIINDKTGDRQIRFTHRDRLGSATTFTDHNGQVTAYRRFDPFGTPLGGDWSQLSPSTLAANLLDTDMYSRRGFTDHEHLDEAELIHMNGRVYDYKVGRFLSVDPIIQSPGNSQSINPYSYIMNNPLAGVDPTGYRAEEITGSHIKRDTSKLKNNGGQVTIGGSKLKTTVGSHASGATKGGTSQAGGTPSTDILNQAEIATTGNGVKSGGSGGSGDQSGNASSSNSKGLLNGFDPFAPTPLDNLQNWIFENLINPMPEIMASVDALSEGDYSGVAQSMVGVVGKKVKAVGKIGESIADGVTELTERVRHFTNNKGLEGIRESGVVRASDQNSVFTERARGRAGSPRDVEQRLGIGPGRGRNYVEFDANSSEFKVIKNPTTGATERVFNGNVDLSGRNATFIKR